MHNSEKETQQTNLLNDPDATDQPLAKKDLKKIKRKIKEIRLLAQAYKALINSSDLDQDTKERVIKHNSHFELSESQYLHFYTDCRAKFILKSLAKDKRILSKWINDIL